MEREDIPIKPWKPTVSINVTHKLLNLPTLITPIIAPNLIHGLDIILDKFVTNRLRREVLVLALEAGPLGEVVCDFEGCGTEGAVPDSKLLCDL